MAEPDDQVDQETRDTDPETDGPKPHGGTPDGDREQHVEHPTGQRQAAENAKNDNPAG